MGRVFISHSTQDDVFVNKLATDLNKEGIATFVDHLDIKPAQNWYQEIASALDACTHMIVIISSDSIASKNCEVEWLYFNGIKKPIIVIYHRQVPQIPLLFKNIQYSDFRDQGVYSIKIKEVLSVLIGETPLETSKPKPTAKEVKQLPTADMLTSKTDLIFPIKRRPEKFIGIATGNIADIKDVDVLVNSENCDLKMARPVDKSVSGALNRLSANRDKNGKITSYPVEEALKRKKAKFAGDVPGATVVVTLPGSLSRNNVKYILHAVAVEPNEDGKNGSSFKPFSRILLGRCVTNVLKEIDALNRKKHKNEPLTRVVMPLFGTGDGGLEISVIAPRLIECAIDYLETANTKIAEVYFVTYLEKQRAELEKILRDLVDLNEPEDDRNLPGIWM